MKAQINIRSSAAPLAIRCGMSALDLPPDGEVLRVHTIYDRGNKHRHQTIIIDPRTDEATLGTAVHEALAAWVSTRKILDPTGLAERYGGLDPDEIERLTATGRRLWAKLEPEFSSYVTETPLGARLSDTVTATGTGDVINIAPTKIKALDWKSGRLKRDYWTQIALYAYMTMETMQADRAEGILVYLRDGEIIPRTFTRDELRDTIDTLVESLTSGVYCPGSHCDEYFCRHRFSCLARATLVRREISDLTGMNFDLHGVIEDGRADELLAFCRSAERAAKDIKASLKAYIEEHGDIPCTSGLVITTREEHRAHLSTRLSWPVLVEHLGADLVNAVTVSLRRAKDAMSVRTPPIGRAAAREALVRALEDVGAITYKSHSVLTQAKGKKGDTNDG